MALEANIYVQQCIMMYNRRQKGLCYLMESPKVQEISESWLQSKHALTTGVSSRGILDLVKGSSVQGSWRQRIVYTG